MIKVNINELKELAEKLENEQKHHDMQGFVFVTIEKTLNGGQCLQFEQPNGYPDCNSNYFRFNKK